MKSIIKKEAQIKMRSWKTIGMVTIYLILLGMTLILIMYASIYSEDGLLNTSNNSKYIFITLNIIQVLMISFIVPILTSGAIAQEREKQTLDILLSTNLRPISIILGKLVNSISQVVLLLVASLPILSLVFLFGGISIWSIIDLFLFYIVISIFFGSIGILFSVLFKKTLVAIVMTYLSMIMLTFGTMFIKIFEFKVVGYTTRYIVDWYMYLNPGVSFWSTIMRRFGSLDVIVDIVPLESSYWLVTRGIFLILSVLMLLLSAYLLNPIRGSKNKTT